MPGSIRFLKLSLRDFRSWKSLDLPLVSQGATLLVGVNGAGKSNIFSGLTWALFGKTAQGISPKDIVRRGSSTCEASVSFVGLSGKVIIQRVRTAAREFVRIYEGTSSEEYGVQEGNRRVFAYLGMDWRTFMNTIFVGGGANRFFLMLPDGEKKKLLEDLLNLDRFRLGYGAASARISQLKLRDEASRTSARMAVHALKRIDQASEELKDSESSSRLFEEIRKVKLKLSYLEKEVAKALSRQDIHAMTIKESQKELDSLREKLGELNYAIAFSNRRIHALSRLEGKTCPECERTLSGEEADQLIQKHRCDLNNFQEPIPEMESLISILQDRMSAAQEGLNAAVGLISKRDAAANRLEDLQEERDKYKADLRSMSDAQRSYFIRRLRASRKISSKITGVLPYFQFWLEGYGSKGLKAEFFGRLLPVLEERGNSYLEKMIDNFSLEFSLEDGGFKTDIISGAFGSMPYATCSTGERRRLDLATSLALCDIVQEASSCQTNLLVLDEVVEGVDAEGAEQFADMIQHLPGNRSVFLVSHNRSLVGCFDKVLTIDKSHGISHITTG